MKGRWGMGEGPDIRAALKSQYHAAMAMLRQAIEDCPDKLWAGGDWPAPLWRVAYHTLFFTHLYLQRNHESFKPWENHREEAEVLGRLPYPPHRMAKEVQPYTKAEVLAYWAVCDGMVDAAVDATDLASADCGFPWYGDMPKLDHQLNNIRHVQHHAALLAGRLRKDAGIDVRWVGQT